MNDLTIYKVTHVMHYDDVDLHIVVGCFESTEKDIESVANQQLCVSLMEDGLHVKFGENDFVIVDLEKEKYQFEIYTKKLPPPIDISTLNKEKIALLLSDERYMVTLDDFEQVDWDLSRAYKQLKQKNPHKKNFSFSSLAYGVERVLK